MTDVLTPKENIRALAHDARKAAVLYEEMPGMALNPKVIADLYRAIARLCDHIDAIKSR